MSEHSSSLAVLLKRLEAATTRLEELALTKSKVGVTGSGEVSSPTTTTATDGDEPLAEFVSGYESMVIPSVEKYLALSQGIGDVVVEQSKFVKEILIDQQRRFLTIAAKAKKPQSQEVLKGLFESSQTSLEKVMKHAESHRPSPLYNHLSTVSSGIASASWVLVSPDTSICVKELTDSSQFYANRVIKTYKETDVTHVEWAKSFVAMLKNLYDYVYKYHKTGLTWNPQGQEVTTVVSNLGNPSPRKPVSSGPAKPPPPPKPASLRSNSASSAGGPPPPPPPPPPAPVDSPTTTSASAPAPDFNSVFSDINKGGAITSGLKKVDPSQMTHKNPDLRKDGGPIAPSSSVPPKAPARSVAKAPAKEPETTLSGHKWLVQYHTGGTVEIEPTELKQIVYVFNCQNTTIQVKGKCNGVVLDTCKKSGVVLETAMASIDVINCQSCQLQVLNTTPTVVIDKTDGLQLYLSSQCLDVEILTAKSSQINILVPETGAGAEEEDFVERAVPEQFKTTVQNGQLVTVTMDHE